MTLSYCESSIEVERITLFRELRMMVQVGSISRPSLTPVEAVRERQEYRGRF